MRTATEAATLMGLAEEYISKRTIDGKSPQTLRVYKYWLTHPIVNGDDGDRPHPGGIAAHVRGVEDLDTLAVTRYFSGLRGRGLKPSTVHQAFRTIRAFARWLAKPEVHGPLPHGNPLADTDIKVPKTLPSVPKTEELQAVLDACDNRSLSGLRSQAMILVMADSGLRIAETLSLRVCDWNRGDKDTLPSFNVRKGKGSKDRIASCGEETARALRRYLEARDYGPLDPLIAAESGKTMGTRGAGQVLHRLSKAAGLPRDRWLHPHALRHFCATSWLRTGVPLKQVSMQLGHESVGTTERYLHLVPDDVARAHAKASPLARLGIRVK